ncbi:chalcone isomerase family protein [Vibrio sp.]|uniref:chalcone isomerase family protein n=1 Tax=Vibrio sp. TaxID=678 RepID=UPI003D0C36AF
MKWIVAITKFSLSLTLLLPVRAASVQDSQTMWSMWPVVGQATLSWLWFDVYTSQLRTPDGIYHHIDDLPAHPVALEIHYLRSISQQQLLEATQKQWQKLGYSAAEIERWLSEFSHMFPSVEQGQRLVYLSDGQRGQLIFFPSQDESEIRGLVQDPVMNEAFLAIWLSPRSHYPQLRKQLIGIN